MGERKTFLTLLRSFFGECGRISFLQKMRDRYSEVFSDVSSIPHELPVPAEMPQYHVIDIDGTDAWHRYVEKLKDISLLENALRHAETLSNRGDMGSFDATIKSMQRNLAAIPPHINKKFMIPDDIDEGTSGEFADKIGAFVKNCILDFMRICHNSEKYAQGEEQKFYADFAGCLEQYLSSVAVYRKDIESGVDLHTYADWFEAPARRETDDSDCVGIIDEIDFPPHFIYFRDEYGDREEKKIKGSCIVFTAMRKK